MEEINTTIGHRLSPILEEIEALLIDHAAYNCSKPDFTDEGFRAGIKIFIDVMLDKLFEVQQKEGENYKVLYNSIVDKDTWFSASLEYQNGVWSMYWEGELVPFNPVELSDYLDEKHYDWRYNLIEQGLAINKNDIE